jgi:hypothetical protein
MKHWRRSREGLVRASTGVTSMLIFTGMSDTGALSLV